MQFYNFRNLNFLEISLTFTNLNITNFFQSSSTLPDSSVEEETPKFSSETPKLGSVIPRFSSKITSAQECSEKSNDINLFYGKRHRQRDFCFFCETLVQSFARHLIRNHFLETEVQHIISLPPKSQKRKELLTSIRKKGNFLNSNDNQKAVKTGPLKKNLLPCNGCLGFYSEKHLWRHRKKCTENNVGKTARADGQNLLLRHLKVDSELREKVFPRMRADHVSLVAKKDPLICEFGSRYIKIHREAHFINVASRKMRELARFLIEMRKLDSSITSLFSVLKPQHFDNIIQATKNIAKYDAEKELYKSPTYALNFGTSIKQCCEIAILHALKKKGVAENITTAEIEADLKSVIQLVTAHWKFSISAQAGNDLNINKWNRVTLIPFASDIKLLKEYLCKKGNEAASKLEFSPDVSSFKILTETVYCRVILLNRKRPGELQRMLLNTYEESTKNVNNQNYEEFSEAVSTTENILMKHFKRVVTRGKRGRGVPVLFSQDVQKHIELMLKYKSTFVQKNNPYLFSQTNSKEPICGYKVLQKYSKDCGARNPSAITSTKLRKHLATLSQIFSMNENDLEQLATFMGHTLGVHRSSYRLPDDVFQTAKIAKILLLMEQGSLSDFKGKTLDEINVDLEADIFQTNDNITDESVPEKIDGLGEEISNEAFKVNHKICAPTQKGKCAVVPVKKRILTPWTDEQKKIVLSFFKKHIKDKKAPKRHECEELLKQFPQMKNKEWQKIKVFVQNKYR